MCGRNELISIDEGVEIVCEIVEDVVAMASDIVLDHYLENKKFSYAVLEAKKEILQFIGVSSCMEWVSNQPCYCYGFLVI